MQDAIPDIPRLYTAIAEWGACIIFILLLPKRFQTVRLAALCAGMLALQIVFLISTGGTDSAYLWVFYMIVAVTIMIAFILLCCRISWRDAVYCGVQSLVLAEFAASLEWQVYVFYLWNYNGFQNLWAGLPFLLLFCGGIYLFYWWLLRRQKMSGQILDIHKNELWSVLIIAIVVFVFSNLSYANTYLSVATPFTSVYGEEIATIRTMVDLGGVAMMLAHYMFRSEVRARQELDTMQQMFQNQYLQYEQSRESIELINYKYHDLKHQIAVLRAEEDPDRRNAYLNRMEEEIRQYEAQYKTGNKVLDTILTSKSMVCQQNDISLNCVADGSLLDFIDEMDLCTILGNALDNAIEYEKKIPDREKRLIHVAIFSQKDFLIMRFENYFEGKLNLNGGLPVTTKKEKGFHGYGLKSIRYTAEKYTGAASVSTRENWFELKILMPLQRKA